MGNALALSICPQPGGDRVDDAIATHFHRGRVAERLMGTLAVVEGDLRCDAEPRFAAVRVALEIDVFVLERAPKPAGSGQMQIQHVWL
jgi:hypothetical protein